MNRHPLQAPLAIALALLVLLPSCVRYRDLVNFNEVRLPEDVELAIVDAEPIVIQTSDLLRITVQSFDIAAAAPFNIEPPNQGAGGIQQLATIELFNGYLVDADGYIDFPVLGRIMARGKTLEALKADVREDLAAYIKEPVVSVRWLNFKVSVLGSVAVPGRYQVTNPRMTIFQALAEAGDLTDYANRDSILVVRERTGERSFAYLNLHTAEVFDSEYYFLEQGDLVYAPPVRTRTAAVQDQGQRFVQYGSAFLSLGALLVAIFR